MSTPPTSRQRDVYFLTMAVLASNRGTCQRRKVGCVLVDNRNRVVSTGYNGVPSGMEHCTTNPCPGYQSKPGTDLDSCFAVHAEANALLRCSSPFTVSTAYCTHSPCIQCMKLLLNSSCRRIVYAIEYPDAEVPMKMWTASGRSKRQITLPNPIEVHQDFGRDQKTPEFISGPTIPPLEPATSTDRAEDEEEPPTKKTFSPF